MFNNQLTEARLAKAEILRNLGLNPFGSIGNRKETIDIEGFIECYESTTNTSHSEDTSSFSRETVFGRIKLLRKMGKSGFLTIESEGSKLQVFVSLNTLNEKFDIFKKGFDIGDIISVTGYAFKTKTEELSIYAEDLDILTKSTLPLPEKFHGLEDQEIKYRKRYLDMITDNSVAERLRARSEIISSIRKYLENDSFIEVETPVLNNIPGGANARPFITHHNALGVDRYLRIAPELYLKRLVVGGLNAVFEVGKNFRNEGIDATHNPEFTSVEFYKAYTDYRDLMELTKDMILSITRKINYGNPLVTFGETEINFAEWTEISFKNSLIKIGSIPEDILDSSDLMYSYLKANGIEVKPGLHNGKLWEELFDNFVEEKLINPTFITEYPTSISPLARRQDSNPDYTERFELFIAGREIANGFNELNDPEDQYERFAEQAKQKDSDDESMFMDKDFIEALMYAMPPTAGAGLGIDRLVMLLTNSHTIKDVIAFPAMK